MKMQNIEKINKLGKVSRIILTIMQVVCIIGIVSCLVGTAVIGFGINSDTVFSAIGTASAQIQADETVKPFIKDLETLATLEEQNFNLLGVNLGINVEKSGNDGISVYDITADLNADSASSIKSTACMLCLAGALTCAIILVAVIFGGKFAKSLEICKTPFEDSVLKSMRHFGFSLLPVILIYISGGIDLTGIVLIIAIIIFMYIFKYGAELQKESDETV